MASSSLRDLRQQGVASYEDSGIAAESMDRHAATTAAARNDDKTVSSEKWILGKTLKV
ncbi:hypothetical protein [Helicobacter zhangjianzhongii]|uniref:Uncharacterized protein n=1 Tax=Helicobacter zhangjianzhongii TaxID=2974574 RepID=A0ACC6FQA5_9HELI|nr:hypothetical protein [Helicobacter sp. CPD2-1]MDL0079228.1 hypothetical protein [Helicobacter sp. CPD2-1]MDL0081257.1 hypothetical protein [Helicobacter sp. XJK30-2]